MTYAELRDAVLGTSCSFRRLGSLPQTVVPVCLGKSAYAVVTLLAIMNCGAAYLPLDPSWSVDRVRSIVSQFEPNLIIVSPGYITQASTAGPKARTLTIGESSPCKKAHDHHGTDIASVSPEGLAYVLMTSGSTGVPKGVKISHRSISTLAIAVGAAMGFTAKSRCLQFSSYSFDGSVLEMIDTLVHGGTSCVPSEFDRKNNLAHAISAMEVNTALFTPALLASLPPEDVATVTTIVVGGDSVPQHLNSRWTSYVRLIEAYGLPRRRWRSPSVLRIITLSPVT